MEKLSFSSQVKFLKAAAPELPLNSTTFRQESLNKFILHLATKKSFPALKENISECKLKAKAMADSQC